MDLPLERLTEAVRIAAAKMGLSDEAIQAVADDPAQLGALQAATLSALATITDSAAATPSKTPDYVAERIRIFRSAVVREQNRPPRHLPASDRVELLNRMQNMRTRSLKVVKGPAVEDPDRGLDLLMLGASKPFSTRPLHDLKPITFKDMQVTKTHKGRVLLLRIVSVPCYLVGISFAAEDTNGRAEHITMYNFPCTATGPDLDALFPLGALCAIREPSFRVGDSENGHAVRCDSASDFHFLEPDSPILADARWPGPAPAKPRPASFDWKALGNSYFTQHKDYLAVRAYSEGVARCSSPDQRLVFYLNRAQANLRLDNFGGAWRDTSAVLSFLKAGISSGPPKAELKATVRRARALEGLRHLERALEEYGRVLEIDATESEGKIGKEHVETMLRQTRKGDYDWPKMRHFGTGWKVPGGLPVADYFGPFKIGRVELRAKGRAVIATEAFSAGDLIMVEKAIAVAANLPVDRTVSYDLTSDTMVDTSKAELVTALAARIMDDSSVAPLIYSLHGGPKFPASGDLTPTSMRDRPLLPFATQAAIDTTRLEAISLVNSFPLGRFKFGYEGVDNFGSGLFLVASMLNHACLPNAIWMNYGDVLVVRARTSIAAGDEICVSYVPGTATESVADAILRQRAMTACGCVMCEDARRAGTRQINQRHKLLDEQMPKFSRALFEEGVSGRKARKDKKPALEKLVKKVEATYPKGGPTFRPDMVSLYHVMSEYCDTTTNAGSAECLKWVKKALMAAGADFLFNDIGQIKPISAPLTQIGPMMSLILRTAAMYVWDGGVVGRQGFAWVRAAWEMSRILWGDSVDDFAERYAADLNLYRLDNAIKALKREEAASSYTFVL